MAVKKATSAARRGTPPKKAAPTKAVARKAATKATAIRARATKAGASKMTGTKARVTRVTGTKATAKKAASKVTTARATTSKATPKKATTKAPATKAPATKAPATKAPATKAPATRATPTRAAMATKAATTKGSRAVGAGYATGATAQPQRLRVRENEKPWTAKELATVRADLEADIVRLQREISVAELDLAGLMQDIGDGAGDDPADAGTATFEREQEISLANNAREVFEQSARALARLVNGSYGICESCGSPIGKNRLLAFPRATLCMTCKSKQERR
jgi:RNA polymerase-binding transcription factor DksA